MQNIDSITHVRGESIYVDDIPCNGLELKGVAIKKLPGLKARFKTCHHLQVVE
jgi:hypothetical protein